MSCLLISLDLGLSSGGRRREQVHSVLEANVEDTVQNDPRLVDGTRRGPWLAVLYVKPHCAALHWAQLHHGLSFTLLLPKESERGNGEQLLESSPSARAGLAYSLLLVLYLFLMCFVLSCVDLPACKASTPGPL